MGQCVTNVKALAGKTQRAREALDNIFHVPINITQLIENPQNDGHFGVAFFDRS